MGPQIILPHYYAEDLDVNEDVCALHGWSERKGRDEPEMWDGILLNTELDLLEIRLNELDIVVDKFFIIESNSMSRSDYHMLRSDLALCM